MQNNVVNESSDANYSKGRGDINHEPNQHARSVAQAMDDTQHARHPFFTNNRINKIRLHTLESEDAYKHNLNTKYIDVQLVYLTTPTPVSTVITYQRKKIVNSNSAVTFSHMILCKIHFQAHPNEYSRLIYLMGAQNLNNNLLNRNINHRDNGAILIGSVNWIIIMY